MKLDKIKELITSPDKDIRLLGLSYLGNKKDSSELFIVPAKENDFRYWKISESLFTSQTGASFFGIYFYISSDDANKRPLSEYILNTYINYCYDSGRD